ncbi:MAG: tetratricopeptide repeat protein [Armatimonadetes bacterium]|nr:tetratricopeptide repeat protein [Armatimonadota bacterium]
MRVWILLLLILPVFLPGGAVASSKSHLEDFQRGDRAFNSGDFGKAEEIYNAIIAESKGRGDNATLLQALENLGAVFLCTFREDDLRRNVEQVKSLKHIVATPNPIAGSSNLLINGGFEEGLSLPWGTGHYETGNFSFGIWWNSMLCRSYAKIDTLISHSGNHSLRITNFSGGQPHVFGTTSQRIRNISPNTLYEIELWARADSLERSAVLIILDPAWHIRPLTLSEGTYDWKHFKVQVNPGDATFVDFRILLQAKGTLWLDDISFRRLGEQESPSDPMLEADLFAARGEFLKAIDGYKALEKESAGNPGRLNYVRGKLGFAYLALAEYNVAMEYFEKVRTPNNTRVLLAIGDIFLNLGQPEKALEHYLPVYKMVSQDQALLSIVADKIAMAYMRLHKLSEAVSFELEALNIMTHINDPHGRAVNYCHLGQIHLKLNQLVKAREYANASLQLSRATGDRKLEGDALQLLALLEGSESRPEKALDLLTKTVEIRTKLHDTYGLIYSLYWQGHFMRLKKDFDPALDSLKECITKLEGVRDHSASIEKGGDTLLSSNEVLYEEVIALLIQLGKSEEALEYLNRSRSDHLRKLFDQQGPRFNTPKAQEARGIVQTRKGKGPFTHQEHGRREGQAATGIPRADPQDFQGTAGACGYGEHQSEEPETQTEPAFGRYGDRGISGRGKADLCFHCNKKSSGCSDDELLANRAGQRSAGSESNCHKIPWGCQDPGAPVHGKGSQALHRPFRAYPERPGRHSDRCADSERDPPLPALSAPGNE